MWWKVRTRLLIVWSKNDQRAWIYMTYISYHKSFSSWWQIYVYIYHILHVIFLMTMIFHWIVLFSPITIISMAYPSSARTNRFCCICQKWKFANHQISSLRRVFVEFRYQNSYKAKKIYFVYPCNLYTPLLWDNTFNFHCKIYTTAQDL